MRKDLLQFAGFIVGFLIISWSTLTPLDQLPPVPGSDKLHHVIGFGGWALMSAFGPSRRFLVMALVIVCWGGAIELIQPSINRYGEWADFIANSTGVLLAMAVHWWIIKPRLK